MTRRAAIMQPTYMPWAGYFAMIDQADVFVFLDDVQLARRSWQVRNRVLGQGDEPQMLSVPVLKTASRDETRICDALIADHEPWRAAHMRALRARYARAPWGEWAIGLWDDCLEPRDTHLSDLTIRAITTICEALGVTTPLLRSSALDIAEADRSGRLLALTLAAGADGYLSAPGSVEYLIEDGAPASFAAAGIDVSVFAYVHPGYAQDGPFVSHLGIVDLLAWTGPEQALTVLRSGLRDPAPLPVPADRRQA